MKFSPLSCFHGLLTVGILATAFSPSLRADVIASDDFTDYALGQAPDHTGGKGWKGVWSIGPKTQAVVESAPGLGGGEHACLRVSGGDTMRALIRRIAEPERAEGKPVYLRVVFDIVAPSEEGAAFSSWSFTSDKTKVTEPATVSTALQGDPTARIGGETQTAPVALQAGQVYVLVACMDGWNAAAKQYESVSLWIDPAESASGNPQAQASGPSGCKLFELLFFRVHNLKGGAYRLFDVRLTTTWAEAIQDS